MLPNRPTQRKDCDKGPFMEELKDIGAACQGSWIPCGDLLCIALGCGRCASLVRPVYCMGIPGTPFIESIDLEQLHWTYRDTAS